ncbi:3-oxoacyl-[acyl-carrier-protein] synthase III [Streptomyces sp. Ag109_O5-1]|uniref:beta-ketoacyl-ACP synthase III n=1 Tax=Streptomyces sp. Ag109_O5-1 TaxID=1938851 RepID=UPI000F4FBB9A|nr:beta-ketoacyl-ACP synthase III [Streptomyces sp. Ag109_O5-1]RPE39188.1 3-oxoacyl-[acyl-carrier-protein] synthase III [Streptomyces sp. Ag109_O5-1]
MRRPSHRNAVLIGIGAYVPPTRISNADLIAGGLDTSDEWIRARTGIATRHIVQPGVATSDLAVEAAWRALESAGTGEVDAVVLATTTPDRPCPATAPDVAARLGLHEVPAFDIAAVCSGFLYGLATAAGLIASHAADRVLLVTADAFSTLINPADRSTAVIFGDGAGAVVLRAGHVDEPGAIGPMVLHSDGAHSDLIEVPAGGARQRVSGTEPRAEDFFFRMQGRETYRHAVTRMTEASAQAARLAGWSMTDIDRFAVHQANARILNSLATRLEFPPDRCLSNIEHVGNTGAASLALLLAQSADSGLLTAGHKVLLTAFGGGLTWGATTLIWPDLPAH